MKAFSPNGLVLLLLSHSSIGLAQDNGYVGYNLRKRGDPEAVNYTTANTHGVDLPEEPDVYLNASVSVGEISIEVQNLTAKVNLDAKVLNLLRFNAGVDASIDKVSLKIEDVSAKVELEARLGNVVQMVGDVLNTIDLNPIVATLGNNVGNLIEDIGNSVGGDSSSSTQSTDPSELSKRDVPPDHNLINNILYSVNDYSGAKHTNRVLAQDGTIYDEFLDNNGNELGRKVVGDYSRDMSFTGHNRTITTEDEETQFELGYEFVPFPGLEIVAYIYVTPEGQVVKTQMVAEAEGGGASTISNDDDSRRVT
ncbi:hypothetical protein DL766_005004 [Monosporascus sp. MC13-8B]|uniref:Uncharacterized protein n=1 Tax=Monosporascus cannonballus TaxID=155416 RepID=A0ABY0HD83_9PEZI|nr:hypothetical protein DL762_004119 [Monosporascus cannonballus]RYP30176.1 hypothetical protein DL766_005004 [Monosporascus sp. MC13-8B]